MPAQNDDRTDAAGAPVERPVRPDSEQWVRSWFAEHYQAGDVFAYCDAEAMTLQAAVQFAQAVAAAERERCARHIDVPWSRAGAEFAAAIRSSDKA